MIHEMKNLLIALCCLLLTGCATSSLSYRGLVNGMHSQKMLTSAEYDRIRQFSEQGYIARSYQEWAEELMKQTTDVDSTDSGRALNEKIFKFLEMNEQTNMKTKINYLGLLKEVYKNGQITNEEYLKEKERIRNHRKSVSTKYSLNFFIQKLEKRLDDDRQMSDIDRQLALKAKQFVINRRGTILKNQQRWKNFGQAMLVGLAAMGEASSSSASSYNSAYGYNNSSPLLVNGKQTYNNSIQPNAFSGQTVSTGGPFGKYNPNNPFSEYSSPFGSYNPNNPFSEYSSPFGSMNKSNPSSEVSSPFGSMNPNNPFSEVSSPFGKLNPNNPSSEVSSPSGKFNPNNPLSEGIDPYHYQEHYLGEGK